MVSKSVISVTKKLRKMKAAQISGFGGRKVLELGDASIPTISSKQLLIRVHAAGVNPIDWKLREGYYKMPLPATLGVDVSGVVEEAGEDVAGFRAGDEIFGMIPASGNGSFAEFTIADEGVIALKPKNASFIEAAAIPLTGLSAWQCLVDQAGLKEGQKVLIHGGAGGIGSFAIQIAKNIGAWVATTVSSGKIEYARKLGADVVVDYTKERFEDWIKDCDVVLDTVGGETYRRSFSVLKKGGTIVSMLEAPDEELMKRYSVTAKSQFTKPNRDELEELARLFDEGKLSVHIERTFTLGEASEALDYIRDKHPMGKVVITV